FENFFMRLIRQSEGRITLKTATDIAAKLTGELFAPIYGQIDPMHLGEAGRAMLIGRQYAVRLIDKGGNFSKAYVDYITSRYPSHGFVIDRREASAMFESIRVDTELERSMIDLLGDEGRMPAKSEDAIMRYLSTEIASTSDDEESGRNK